MGAVGAPGKCNWLRPDASSAAASASIGAGASGEVWQWASDDPNKHATSATAAAQRRQWNERAVKFAFRAGVVQGT